jgi:hypothetical protein
MAKKHIIRIGYHYFATDSINSATQLVALLSKMTPSRYKAGTGGMSWEPDSDKLEIALEMNRRFEDPEAKVKAKKPLALPAPKRGTILCICEKSYVSPRHSCPHCGRSFTESHNRTHSSTASQSGLALD